MPKVPADLQILEVRDPLILSWTLSDLHNAQQGRGESKRKIRIGGAVSQVP